ncbi:hypothetical protein M3202_21490 [Alkalihalobacillus oceani]|uniref:TraC-like domain-containing protein n=1 Tax=Halalkalibacter oceani TaxID=1653776 RepID=A0A9X2DT69_9BACI|nr:hypothetical protein [Halalkalibacter oceani]MCM3716619.1 hypothetical protein [Halalkalibacter oceani]
MSELIQIVLFLLVGYLIYRKLQSRYDTGENKKKITTQDILNYKNIDENGIVELHNGNFAMVIEVEPINLHMKSQREKDSIWFAMRSFSNSIPTSYTLLVQSHFLDIAEYIEDYRKKINQPDSILTPQLIASGNQVARHLETFSERKTRDYRCYVIVRYNPYKDALESNISTGSRKLDHVFEKTTSTQTIPPDEAYELTESLFDEVADLVYQNFDTIGIKIARLNKLGIHDMLHQTLNRDLSPYHHIGDLYLAGAFSDNKQSVTPSLSLENRRKERELRELEIEKQEEVI